MKPQQQFEKLQSRWRAAIDKVRCLRRELREQYGDDWRAPAGKQARLERAVRAEDLASDAIFEWLDTHSPRSWRTGCPAHWICDELTYSDAITAGQLSVIPPVAWGYCQSDSVRFAMPLAIGGVA